MGESINGGVLAMFPPEWLVNAKHTWFAHARQPRASTMIDLT